MSQNPLQENIWYDFATNPLKYNDMPPLVDLDIKDFKEAFDAILDTAVSQMKEIMKSDEEPSFENIIAADAHVWEDYRRLLYPFANLLELNQTDEWFKMSDYIAEQLEAKSTKVIYADNDFFQKVDTIYQTRDALPEYQQRKVKAFRDGMINNGAELEEAQKQRLSEISVRLDELSTKFSANINGYYKNAYTFVDDVTKLDGLPQAMIEAAKELSIQKGEPDQWCLTEEPETSLKYLMYLKDRDFRDFIFYKRSNACMEGEFDNYPVLSETLALREEKVEILGDYNHYADFQLRQSMPGGYKQVLDFLDNMYQRMLAAYAKDLALLEEFAFEKDGISDLRPSDLVYYERLYRDVKFNINQEELMEYFTIESVFNGFLEHSQKLFGITFEERADIKPYHETVQYFDVYDNNDGQKIFLGTILFDPNSREDKSGGMWMSTIQGHHIDKNGVEHFPIAGVYCNYTPATKTKPTLLSNRERELFWHEWGHGLHVILSQSPRFETQSGTHVRREFVELASQIQERWSSLPHVLRASSAHYETGEPLSDEMIERVLSAEKALISCFYLRQNKMACQDMLVHTLTDLREKTADYYREFDQTFATEHFAGLTPYDTRSSLSIFKHINGWGYHSLYWAYAYSEVLDACGFSLFEQNGYYDQKTAQKLRQLMDYGSTKAPMDIFVEFYGSEPDLEPFLKRTGLL